MPAENRSSKTEMVSVPRHIGKEPLTGSFYTAECTRCGWVGSSGELTDDAQCTRIEGDSMCLGDTEEIGTDRLLGIVQAMTQPTEPFAWIGDYAACGGGKAVFDREKAEKITDRMCVITPVYTHADPEDVERPSQIALSLQTKLKSVESDRDRLRAKLAEQEHSARELLRIIGMSVQGSAAYNRAVIAFHDSLNADTKPN